MTGFKEKVFTNHEEAIQYIADEITQLRITNMAQQILNVSIISYLKVRGTFDDQLFDQAASEMAREFLEGHPLKGEVMKQFLILRGEALGEVVPFPTLID